ncbi:hypothetical protein [Nocardia bhagyanarayanae]|nr:hypothetical protein [Nocardia bhagyanarayanae]
MGLGGPPIDLTAVSSDASEETGEPTDQSGVPEWATTRSGYPGTWAPPAPEPGGAGSETASAQEIQLLLNETVVATGPVAEGGDTKLTVPADITIAAGDVLTMQIAEVVTQEAEMS